MSRPCTVGLTGGLASGKSTVAVLLARRGADVLDADAQVHKLYRAGGAGAAAVAELFGDGVLAPDGSVERTLLAERVWDDAGALERLNRAIHPLVREVIESWLEELAGQPTPPRVAVVEAALLVETGAWSGYDLLLVVGCRPEQQLQRALARGFDEDHARRILEAQLPLDDKLAAADLRIDNSGDRESLVDEVERAWQEILRRCRR